jgi:hypothetical protein
MTWSAAPTRTSASRALGRERRRDDCCRTGITWRRLERDIGLNAELAQLLGDHEAEIGSRDHDRMSEEIGISDPSQHLLERRLRANQGHELLWHDLARDRPQPHSRAAAYDRRNDGCSHATSPSPMFG